MLIPTTIVDSTQGLPVIFDQTLGVDGASIDTGPGGVPVTYAALMISAYMRTTEAVAFSSALMRFNNDASAIYDRTTIRNENTTLAGATTLGGASLPIRVAGASVDANHFSSVMIWIPNYAASTGFNKCVQAVSAVLSTDATECSQLSLGGLWRSAAPINRVSFIPGGGDFVTGTRVTIYGLSGR